MNAIPPEFLRSAYAALEANRFAEAKDLFTGAVAAERNAPALEGLAMAAWLTHDERTVFEAREEAFQLYRAAGDLLGAARMAIWLSDDALSFRGQGAVSNGWLNRAKTLLADVDLAREHGWLKVMEADHTLMMDNDVDGAVSAAGAAVAIGRQTGDGDLEMYALSVEGLCLLTRGEVEAGLAKLDEAGAGCLAGEVRQPWIATSVFCYMLDGCDRARDFERATQWFQSLDLLNKKWNAPEIYAFCRPHYAVVLTWRGAWSEAESQLQRSIDDLTMMRPPMAVEGLVRLAELRWRQGRWDEAATLFEQTRLEPLAQLGRAMLALDNGEPREALELVERCLRRLPRHDRLERMPAIELQVRCLIAMDNPSAANDVLPELNDIAANVRTRPVQAAVALTHGLLEMGEANYAEARRRFEDAVDLYEAAMAPFETARVRLELAGALLALERETEAMREAHVALAGFQKLGAQREVERVRRFLSRITASHGRESDAAPVSGLTRRESEVLALISQGLSNQEIAAHLVLSVRTVERHVSTIYEKLALDGRNARASAAAYALGVRREAPGT